MGTAGARQHRAQATRDTGASLKKMKYEVVVDKCHSMACFMVKYLGIDMWLKKRVGYIYCDYLGSRSGFGYRGGLSFRHFLMEIVHELSYKDSDKI